MPSATFNKRIYNFPAFSSAVGDIVTHFGDLCAASRGGRVSKPLAEKIMLTVTHVNGCRYCSYGHSRAALAVGVSEAELQKLLQGEIGAFPEQEAVALAFAQHYAETCCQPEPAACGLAATSTRSCIPARSRAKKLFGSNLDRDS